MNRRLTFPRFLSGFNELDHIKLLGSNVLAGCLEGSINRLSSIGTIFKPITEGFFENIFNEYGSLRINELSIVRGAPIGLYKDHGTYSLDLQYDNQTIQVIDGKLKAIIPVSPTDASYTFASPLTNTQIDSNNFQVSLSIDQNTMELNGGNLSVIPLTATVPMSISNHDASLLYTSPFTTDTQGRLSVKLSSTVSLDDNGALKVTTENLVKGRGSITIYDSPTDWLGLFDFDTDLVDYQGALITLKTSPTFTQINGTLEIVSKGYRNIPFYSALGGFEVDELNRLQYNETLGQLSVSQVLLDESFGITDGRRAIPKSYLGQYIQASAEGAIDVLAEVNSRRELNVRTDGVTVIKNPANQLKVNVTEIAGNNLIATGDTLNAKGVIGGNNVWVEETEAFVVNAKGVSTLPESGVSVVETVNSFEVVGSYRGGDNVYLTGDIINAKGVSCAGSLIYTENPFMHALYGKTVVSGEGIMVVDTGFSYVISAIAPVKMGKDDEQQEEKDNQTFQDTQTGQQVTISGPVLSILPAAVGAIAGELTTIIAGTTVVGAPFAIAGVTGIVAGLGATSGGFGSIFGYPKQQATDSNGNPMIDATTGLPIFSPGSNIAQITHTDGCTRLLFDTPTCWKGYADEFYESAINKGILEEWNTGFNQPWVANFVSQTISLAATRTYVDATFQTISGMSNYLTINSASSSYQPRSNNLTGISTLSPTGTTYLYYNNGWTTKSSIGYSELTGTPDLSMFARADALGALASKDTISYATDVTGKPDLSVYALQSSLGSLATLSSIDYSSTYLTGKPNLSVYALQSSLGSLANKSFIDYNSSDLINRPDLSIYETSSHASATYQPKGSYALASDLSAKQDLISVTTGLTKSGATLGINFAYVQQFIDPSYVLNLRTLTASDSISIGAEQVATKNWVNSLGFLTTSSASATYQPLLTAGTGLTLSNNTISVNAAQTQVTSLGTLTGLTSSGVVSITNTTAATSASTGAFIVSGGVGIGGNLYVGGNLYSGGNILATQSWVTGQGFLTTTSAATTYQTKLSIGSGILINSNIISADTNVLATQSWVSSQNYATNAALSGSLSPSAVNLVGASLNLTAWNGHLYEAKINIVDDLNYSGSLVFYIAPSGSASSVPTEVMRLRSDLNVSIANNLSVGARITCLDPDPGGSTGQAVTLGYMQQYVPPRLIVSQIIADQAQYAGSLSSGSWNFTKTYANSKFIFSFRFSTYANSQGLYRGALSIGGNIVYYYHYFRNSNDVGNHMTEHFQYVYTGSLPIGTNTITFSINTLTDSNDYLDLLVYEF